MKDYRTNPDRIDPNHALAKAAREVNGYCDEHGLKGTVEWLGMNVTVDQLRYIAEQRALRAFAARYLGYKMGKKPEQDEQVASMLVMTEQWKKLSTLITAAYMDGIAIGYKGKEIADEIAS